jgi:iron complex transport system substrate-binding protein
MRVILIRPKNLIFQPNKHQEIIQYTPTILPNMPKVSNWVSILPRVIEPLTYSIRFQITTLLSRYLLVPKGSSTDKNILFDGIVVPVPLSKIGVFSSTFLGMIDALDALETIILVERKNYIYNSEVLSKIENGSIAEIGELPNINTEKLLIAEPEVVFLSGLSAEIDKSLSKPQEYGIHMIQNFDWMESHPLAKAEWIKFFGAFLGKEQLADSLFNVVQTNYISYQNAAETFTTQPNMLFSSMYSGTWYIPGGQSYIATLTRHANGTYPWTTDQSAGSLPLSFESVVAKSLDADIWINPDVSSKTELIDRDKRYAQFFEGKPDFLGVFQNDKRSLPSGGNDYYEMGAFRVDWVLRDMLILLHPEFMSKDSLYFYRELN